MLLRGWPVGVTEVLPFSGAQGTVHRYVVVVVVLVVLSHLDSPLLWIFADSGVAHVNFVTV
jgi:hypothetical protein